MAIDNRTIQQALIAKGVYAGKIDGIIGAGSLAGMRRVMAGLRTDSAKWSDDRVRIAFEQILMRGAGINVGTIDGVRGPMYDFGLEQWQNRARDVVPPTAAVAHLPTVFPREKDALTFYGEPGTGHVRIEPPYPVYFGNDRVKSILIHGKCAESAVRAMKRVAAAYSLADIHRLGFDAFSGCFNNRPKRGGTSLSMHAFAAAIDWNAPHNPLRADHRTASFAKPECAAFLDAWEAEGWISLGRERDFDWMHVQAARL